MTFIVLTKWAVNSFGGKVPALQSLGLQCTDITSQALGTIGSGKYLLCMIDSPDQQSANAIESGNLGVILWQSGDGPLTAALVTTIKAKLLAYGVPTAALNKIAANTSLATIQSQIRTILQGQ